MLWSYELLINIAVRSKITSLQEKFAIIMGNTFESGRKSSFEITEPNPFNAEETAEIKLRYKEVLSSTAIDGPTFTNVPVNKLLAFHPNLIMLWERNGTLGNIGNFEKFVGDAMRVNSLTTLELFWSLLLNESDKPDGHSVLFAFFHLMLCLLDLQQSESSGELLNEIARTLVRAVKKCTTTEMNSKGKPISIEESLLLLKQWVGTLGSCIPEVFKSYLTQKCFPNSNDPSFFPFRKPNVENDSYLLPKGASALIPLSLYSNALQGEWRRLYSTAVDGISFNRVVHHIMGYEGPIIILIKPQGDQHCVFGAFTTGRWKEANRFYGTSDTFLFTLEPEFKIMKSRERSNGNYQWLNTKSYGLPHGLAIGGSLESFRLFISESFDNCVASDSCLTFEGGNLLPESAANDGKDKEFSGVSKSAFEIDHLEVYACGGKQIIERGMKALANDREIRDENIQRARKVDKAQFFNNAFDREFLLSGTFAHTAQSADRSEP